MRMGTDRVHWNESQPLRFFRRMIVVAATPVWVATLFACGEEAEIVVTQSSREEPSKEIPQPTSTPWGTALPLGLDPDIPVPADNPMSEDKIALGRLLFFDPLLSSDGSIACASCHVPAAGGTDNRPTSPGIGGQRGGRSAPTVVNSAYVVPHFWDGRAASLEAQAKRPQTNPIEMGNSDLNAVASRVSAIEGYRLRFERAFGSPEVTPDRIAQAIASYERTLLSGNAAYDRFEAGESAALGADEQQGLELFRGKAFCITCHTGANFTDNGFHNLGVGVELAEGEVDSGRMLVTEDPADWAAFKTPTLRNVARTAPYMHDGSEPTLEAVVEFYDRGGVANKNLDNLIRPLGLSAGEKSALVAFLKALDGEILNAEAPASEDFPR